MEDGNDLDPSLKKQGAHELLTEILKKESISSIEELREAQLRYCNARFGDERGKTLKERDEIISRENRRIRRYALRKVIDWLFPNVDPESLIECGSAGDASVAMELPNTHVASVDEDQNMFKYNLVDGLPSELFQELGQKKPGIVKLGLLYTFLDKGINQLISETIPNLSVYVEDVKRLSFTSNKFDVALVQGTPDMLDFFLPEMTRVVKPDGKIVSIVYDTYHPHFSASAYDSKCYNGWPKFGFREGSELSQLGLSRLDPPKPLLEIENLSTYKDSTGKQLSAGIVFEVFTKER